MSHDKYGRLKCDGWCGDASAPQDCPSKVTHIDEKGYAYCTPCGIQRKQSHRCRKLTPRELKTITSGGQIAYYKPRKVECYRCQAKHPASEGGYCAGCRELLSTASAIE
ncbi:MAG: hypothetical protein ACYDDA_13700 [Acidiferrobacteraceae bacterium]